MGEKRRCLNDFDNPRFLPLNHSEQQIRQCVIDRRITQGTRSEAGMRYHERMWSMIATCKKQSRSVFSFLQESITAKLAGQPAPSLLGLASRTKNYAGQRFRLRTILAGRQHGSPRIVFLLNEMVLVLVLEIASRSSTSTAEG